MKLLYLQRRCGHGTLRLTGVIMIGGLGEWQLRFGTIAADIVEGLSCGNGERMGRTVSSEVVVRKQSLEKCGGLEIRLGF